MREFLLLLCLFWIAVCAAEEKTVVPETIVIDTGKEIADVSRHPLGININYLMDDDHNRKAARPTVDGLQEMGVRFLRYPGGDKSDTYLWSVPPFDKPHPALARTGPDVWPSCDKNLVEADRSTYKIDPLDFDEFMQMARKLKTNAEPVIVVCHEPMYHAAEKDGTSTSRERLIETAAAWVRYANITKKYGVKYWEIGNETWLKTKKGDANAEQYAQDVIEFSRAMKAVDPTIKIGANAAGTAWYKTLIEKAAGSFDYFSVHEYPCWEWKNYETYRAKNAPLAPETTVAAKAIDQYATPEDKARIKIAITEMNAADWSKDGWPQVNDTGHALVLCDIVGQMLQHPRIDFLQVWNTRWVKNDTASPPELWDALDKDNHPNPTGRILAIWNQVLLEKMLAVEQTEMVRVFASTDAKHEQVHALLINKDTAPHQARIEIRGGKRLEGSLEEFCGTSAEDLHPTFQQAGNVKIDGALTLTLKPLSVTVLRLK